VFHNFLDTISFNKGVELNVGLPYVDAEHLVYTHKWFPTKKENLEL